MSSRMTTRQVCVSAASAILAPAVAQLPETRRLVQRTLETKRALLSASKRPSSRSSIDEEATVSEIVLNLNRLPRSFLNRLLRGFLSPLVPPQPVLLFLVCFTATGLITNKIGKRARLASTSNKRVMPRVGMDSCKQIRILQKIKPSFRGKQVIWPHIRNRRIMDLEIVHRGVDVGVTHPQMTHGNLS
ncbi:hypothetical protein B0I72DRAFT_38745 [Yarrowia lipolytica]|uniref:Uncharacterized protein n=1 Tax=Yarrowia lipolytica TaxID=4952 RepID=A0A371C5H9_YARLL|nr:hypothetical protein B0I71DRAFT_39511 [Yarrowia lipolytica]RDW32327.1 hypothetical protein B0I72DRAFT_38745 [Yarrowia lipolytica]RDW38820.1 hypothetical protein B0I73DRAFT_40681 [Yarrowia lipolytica]